MVEDTSELSKTRISRTRAERLSIGAVSRHCREALAGTAGLIPQGWVVVAAADTDHDGTASVEDVKQLLAGYSKDGKVLDQDAIKQLRRDFPEVRTTEKATAAYTITYPTISATTPTSDGPIGEDIWRIGR